MSFCLAVRRRDADARRRCSHFALLVSCFLLFFLFFVCPSVQHANIIRDRASIIITIFARFMFPPHFSWMFRNKGMRCPAAPRGYEISFSFIETASCIAIIGMMYVRTTTNVQRMILTALAKQKLSAAFSRSALVTLIYRLLRSDFSYLRNRKFSRETKSCFEISL